MQFTGNVVGVSRDWNTDKFQITFSINEPSVVNEINDIKDLPLTVKAVKYSKKRSLDANAYLWVLCTKIANHNQIKSTKDEVYEEMLQKYGYCYEDDQGFITITVKANVDMTRIDGHWKFVKESADGKWKSYLMIKGTSEYDTREMAHFLDMVVEEAKELGIETMTPDEIEKLKAAWGKTDEKRIAK